MPRISAFYGIGIWMYHDEIHHRGGRTHTYAALMIAAGVNAKALSAYMGHSSITAPSAATAT